MKRRILSIILALALCFGTVLVLVGCSGGDGSSSLKYELSEDGKYYTVVGIGNKNASSVTIPERYKDVPVKRIGDGAFFSCEKLKSVVIPDGITYIGDEAFLLCTSLLEVKIPDSVTIVGVSAFYNCTSLKSVTIGESVQKISTGAFYRCTSLRTISIPKSVTVVGMYAFNGCHDLTVYCSVKEKPEAWNDGWFYGCDTHTSTVVWAKE